ncbi:hydantoinase B/oxoprolinase family protein [Chloroflexota bacterium]
MIELDPVKYEVFYQRLDKLLNEGKEVLRYLSGSVITREAGEVQEAYYRPDGEAVHLAAGILMHIMNVTRVIRYMNANQYDTNIGIYENDQFINNDAYLGGMHNPDTGVIEPLFYKGKHLGYLAGISHTTEVGAIETGGMPPSATEAIHDGLHLPAVKLVDRGKMRMDVLNLIYRGVRDSAGIELDIRARIAGNERAKRRLTELIDDVGLDFFEAASEKLLDDAEIFARDRIKTLKPGIYRARMFDDCFGTDKEKLFMLELETEVTEAGDLLFRIPICSPEYRGFNNAYLPAVEATAFYTLLSLLLYDCRWNTGMARAIKIEEVPEGSRLNASPNASVAYATIGIAHVFCGGVIDAVSRALYTAGRLFDVTAPVTPIAGTAVGGINRWGGTSINIITSSSVSEGGGAVMDADGHDSTVTVFNPWTYISDAEAEETILPILHIARRHRPNSGGLGKFRGGTGTENWTMVYQSPSFTLTKYGSGQKTPSTQGLFGGYPGPATFFEWMINSNLEEIYNKLPDMTAIGGEIDLSHLSNSEYFSGHVATSSGDRRLTTGDMWHSTTHSGAGGLGDPIERDPALIVEDIENRMVTLEVVQRAYAVAIDPETLKVDHQKTEQLRAERRKERLVQGIPGIKYLEQLVRKREDKQLPQVVLDFIEETSNFSPHFIEELEREKELVARGFQEVGEVKVREKLLSLTPYVDIVIDDKGRKLAVCSQCGFVYCEADDNFKYHCLVYDREPADYYPGSLAYDKEWCVFREFYCPSCASQVEVESCVPGMPILCNYEVKL